MKNAWLLPVLATVSLCTSCLKDELPVPKHEDGSGVIHPGDSGVFFSGEACVGPTYADQVWYDLGTNSIVRTNPRTAWDLAFESAPEGWHIRVNGAHFMRAYPCEQTDIALPTDTAGFGPEWRIDASSGEPDSTAIGDWRTDQRVRVLEMGFGLNGLPLPARKLRVIAMDATSFTFETALLNGSDVQQHTVQKDAARRYVHFSLVSGQQVEIAPPDGTYDLVFTQYTYQFHDPFLAYLVTGVVNGASGARTARLTGADFAALTLEDIMAVPLSTAEDVIGYDWKTYDFGTSLYTVNTSLVYVLQDTEGRYYKLHFIDFYNAQGQRGCPRFEVVAYP